MSQRPAPLDDLEKPTCSFASDNTAGVATPVLEAMIEANVGPAAAYGDDTWTARLEQRMAELFGSGTETLVTFGGTGANIVGLSTLVGRHEGIVCASSAHINVDECGAPERFLGVKLIDVDTADGKLTAQHVAATLGDLGEVHHVQPGVVSITQATEYGTLYTVEELAEVVAVAKGAGLRVHMDGARLANAVAALGASVKELTVDLGVDVLSFGGTKNGMAYGEAVLVFDPGLAHSARFARKQAAQLPSKARFVAAQFLALLEGDLWIEHGSHANAMAQRLAAGAGTIDGVSVSQVPEANAVFARLGRAAIERLQAWSPFHVWCHDAETPGPGGFDEVRWMTSFETTTDDVDRFVAGIAAAVADPLA